MNISVFFLEQIKTPPIKNPFQRAKINVNGQEEEIEAEWMDDSEKLQNIPRKQKQPRVTGHKKENTKKTASKKQPNARKENPKKVEKKEKKPDDNEDLDIHDEL